MTKKVVAVDRVIGRRIRLRRRELGLSQTELARELGVTFQQVQKYENGSNRIAAVRLFGIARALCVSILTFFPEDDAAGAEPLLRDRQRLSHFLESGGVRLCRALIRIPNPRTRRAIIALSEEIAGEDMPATSA